MGQTDGLLELRELVAPDGLTDPRALAARDRFWAYCRLINPKFYREERTYQRELCDTLQGLFEGSLVNPATGTPYRKLMINLPPRHGKSYTLTLFVQWRMGRDNATRVISVSYNDILAGRFARGVRDGIEAQKIDSRFSVFGDVFPSTRVKYGDASAQLWSLEGQYFSYLAAGFGGTMTGFGCSLGIIDDPLKNNEEAYNDAVLDGQWAWYADTFLSRVEEEKGGLQIVTMTRWSTRDLCGRLLDSEDGGDWLVFRRPACLDERRGDMLCDGLLSYQTYEKRRRVTSPEIFDANYQQTPVDIKGKLYSLFAVYDDLPRDGEGAPDFDEIVAYVDTADTGADDLCSLVAGIHDGEGYVLDVLLTGAPMEETEPLTARQLAEHGAQTARIESNNGGRGFARDVERLLWERYGTRGIAVEWFHQSANKHARILTASSFVMLHIKFPADWAQRWPKYHAAMTRYQRAGKNAHDDAPDATTGLAELIQDREGHGKLDIRWV